MPALSNNRGFGGYTDFNQAQRPTPADRAGSASLPVGAGAISPPTDNSNETHSAGAPLSSFGSSSMEGRGTQFYAGGGQVEPQRSNGGQSFAGGGAIDEETGDVNSPMGGLGGAGGLQSALSVVQEVLSYGRKLHGLGGDQVAGRMPTTPGTPSESGVRERPMPGPLPPTKTPFGKRAEAEEPEPAQEQVAEGGIETDDEELA